MGLRLHAQLRPDQPYVEAVSVFTKAVVHRLQRPWLQPDALFNLTSAGRKMKRALAVLHRQSTDMIKQRREQKTAATTTTTTAAAAGDSGEVSHPRDFLSILLEARYDDGQPFQDREIREEVDTFLFEGHDTTAAGVAWSLYCLARHPEIAEKCAREVREVLGTKAKPEQSDLQQLEARVLFGPFAFICYCNALFCLLLTCHHLPPSHHLRVLQQFTTACIKEAMRLYPPYRRTSRQTTAPLEVNGVALPIGSEVTVVPYLIHRFPGVWRDPETYRPERFLRGGEAERVRTKYVSCVCASVSLFVCDGYGALTT